MCWTDGWMFRCILCLSLMITITTKTTMEITRTIHLYVDYIYIFYINNLVQILLCVFAKTYIYSISFVCVKFLCWQIQHEKQTSFISFITLFFFPLIIGSFCFPSLQIKIMVKFHYISSKFLMVKLYDHAVVTCIWKDRWL